MFMNKDQREVQRKLRILRYADEIGHVAKTCGYFGIGRSRFNLWRQAYAERGEAGMDKAPPIPKSHANRTPPEREENVLYLFRKYHLGPMRIVWYLERYHDIKISEATVSRKLRRNGLNCLPRGTPTRKVHTKRYQKQVPSHHIQMDVKFPTFRCKRGEKVRRFQFAAINDATRERALKVYEKHTQANAIDFVNHIIAKCPFRIREIRTEWPIESAIGLSPTGHGHEFQAKFHWHVEDLGIRHTYISRATPKLNGKVERSHRSDQKEFYQLLSYKGDVYLEERLGEWERFYSFHRTHGVHKGKTPYEALREKLYSKSEMSRG